MTLTYDNHLLPAYDRAFPGRPRPDRGQRDAITCVDDALFVVAGPGSGKTTVLTLRILHLIFCGQVPPNAILATTFTVKAAAELRSRLLGWGFGLQKELLTDSSITGMDRAWLESVDINQVATGTLDSICQQVLAEHRAPAEQPPVLIDQFLANTVLVRKGLFPGNRYQDPDFDSWLMQLNGGGAWGWNLGRKRIVLATIWDRLQQDLTDVKALAMSNAVDSGAKPHLLGALSDYRDELKANHWLDFGMLERRVLEDLQSGTLGNWAKKFRTILVDEYQDTNLLQEQIYFELLNRGGAGITVVGDDDQSLYRFRGAVVELFSDFPKRLKDATQRNAKTVFLTINYRSTDQIIRFSDVFIRRDSAFQCVRVAGKPPIVSPSPKKLGLPVFGIFRPNVNALTGAVATFISDLASSGGFLLPNGNRLRLEDRKQRGDLGDICLLCSSPAEFKRGAPARPGGSPPAPELRFPGSLRSALSGHNIQVFNPRGSPLGDVLIVRQLGGLLLEALDDRGMVQATDSAQKRLGPDAQRLFPDWRNEARVKQRSDPDLNNLITTWQNRAAPAGYRWPTSVTALELLYGIIHFLPEFHDDPEGQAYLEVFSRQLAAMSGISGFEGRIVTNPGNPGLSEASVRDLLCDWLAPIASDTAELDEGMIGSFPRDRLSILSIHQSKGLEFPMVLVDIGSDFKTNHRAHAFKRHPSGGSMSHTLEDIIRPLSGIVAPTRSARDRAFDDLERLYYVAFTRAQEVLVLLGLDSARPANGAIPNVAASWDRQGTRHGANWPITYLD
jgi:DNA helicase II / ATP-dependent DNA helicase PcrA